MGGGDAPTRTCRGVYPNPHGAVRSGVLAARVIRTLEDNRLLEPGDRVLCAISGGADSTALLHVLAGLAPRLGVEVEAATVDHGLRPGSAAEAERAAAHAISMGVQCEIVLLGLAPGPGAQERARAARYEQLEKLAIARGARVVAVGHTLDDQAETVLARLIRGAGLRGLVGVLPRRGDGVIRPLLDCTRREVEGYLAHHGIEPTVADPSNADDRFQRVRTRSRVLPASAAEGPEVARTVAALADEAREVRDWISGLAETALRELARPPECGNDAAERGNDDRPVRLDADGLARLPGPVRLEVLRRWGETIAAGDRERRLGRAHIEALERVLLTGRGDALLPGGVRVRNQAGMMGQDTSRAPDAARGPTEASVEEE